MACRKHVFFLIRDLSIPLYSKLLLILNLILILHNSFLEKLG